MRERVYVVENSQGFWVAVCKTKQAADRVADRLNAETSLVPRFFIQTALLAVEEGL